jgi:hypothetical protein
MVIYFNVVHQSILACVHVLNNNNNNNNVPDGQLGRTQ